MTTSRPTLAVTASLERSLVDATGDDTGLVVTINAPELPGHDRPQRTPIDIAFILDHSGSMAGDKLRLVKEAVDVALDHLSDRDRVSLVIFDDDVKTLHNLAAATRRTKSAIRRQLGRIEAGSTTNLSGGWLTGCQELAADLAANDDHHRPRRALLLTDGLANVGITAPAELMKHANELRLRGITTTAIGVGTGFDEMLLSGMTEAGGGTFQYIAQPSELSAFFAREISDLVSIVAMKPRLRLTLPHGVCAHLVNSFPHEREGKTIAVDLRDLASGDTIDLVFDIRIAPGEIGSRLTPSITLSWTDVGEEARSRSSKETSSFIRATAHEVALAPTDDATVVRIALERSARTQRNAIELDRAGQFEESRRYMRVSHDILMSAPESHEVLAERRVALKLFTAPMTPLSEDTRKERIFSQMRRSRGSRSERE